MDYFVMSLFQHVSRGLIAALFLSTPAKAAMTAQDAWDFVLALNADYGVTVEAARRNATTDTLTMTDVAYVMPLPGGAITGAVDEIRLVPQGDGSVLIRISDSHRMQLSIQTEGDAAPLTAAITVEMPDLSVIVSGTPQDASLNYFAPAITLLLDDLQTQGETVPMMAVVDLEGLEMTYAVRQTDRRETISDGTVAAAGFVVSLSKPSGDGQFDAEGAFVEMGFSGTGNSGTAPSDLTTDTIAELLRQGLSTDASISHAGSDLSFTLVDGTANAAGRITSDNGRLDLSLSQAGLSYAGATEGLEASFESSEVPLPPLSAQADAMEFSVSLPIQKSDTPEDVDLLIDLDGLSLAEPIWQIFDPAGVLPRGPATLVLDLAAKANWLTDILDPEVAGRVAGDVAGDVTGKVTGPVTGDITGPVADGIDAGSDGNTAPDTDAVPAEIHALDIRQLKLTAAGADLTGSGTFTFDNNVASPFGPGPKPQGKAQMRVDGVNALLQNLTRMGVLPQQQAMMAQMTLGLFARPVEGEDAVTATFEITPDGAVMANGQRLQ